MPAYPAFPAADSKYLAWELMWLPATAAGLAICAAPPGGGRAESQALRLDGSSAPLALHVPVKQQASAHGRQYTASAKCAEGREIFILPV